MANVHENQSFFFLILWIINNVLLKFILPTHARILLSRAFRNRCMFVQRFKIDLREFKVDRRYRFQLFQQIEQFSSLRSIIPRASLGS